MVAFARFHATLLPNIVDEPGAVSDPTDSAVHVLAFRDLFDEEHWQRLIVAAEEVEFAAGAVLMRRGEPEPPLYVVVEGSFEIVDTRSSPETVLDVLGPGEVMGDMSFVDHEPASAEVRAHSHARCLRWQVADLSRLLDAQPDLALQFYKATATTVVVRARTVMSAALAGGFGAGGPSRERGEAVELDRMAYSLAFDLLDTLAGEGSEADPRRAAALAEAMTSTCRSFLVAGESGRVMGARLHELLAEVLSSSTTAVQMLARPEGSPAGPSLFRHVLANQAEGRDPAGRRFDRALLDLPTFRGWRWRDEALAAALAEALPASGARVLSVSLTGAPTSDAQLAVLRAHSGHVTSVQLSGQADGAEPPPGITRSTVVADLPSLLRGTGPRVAGPHHAILIDRVCDVVPDEILRALFGWARLGLHSAGQLLVGHAIPADDIALLEHLLRWPSLPRRSPAIAALLPSGGAHSARAPHDDEAAGLVSWRPRA